MACGLKRTASATSVPFPVSCPLEVILVPQTAHLRIPEARRRETNASTINDRIRFDSLKIARREQRTAMGS